MSDAAFHCMKASPKKLLPLALIGIAVTSLFSAQPAQAYTVTLKQMGANVMATGSGAINLTGLTFSSTENGVAGIRASTGDIIMVSGSSDLYTGFTGPTNFGSGGTFGPNTSNGDHVGINSSSVLGVPAGYVSGNALSDTMTFNNSTFASLGVTPGTHEWTWGTGLP